MRPMSASKTVRLRERADVKIERVVTYCAPYDYCHDRYQAYYAGGIRAAVEEAGGHLAMVSLSRFENLLRRLRRLRSSHRLNRALGPDNRLLRSIDTVARRLGGLSLPSSRTFHPLVGQYLFRLTDGSQWNVCIDSQDSGEIACDGLLQWSDLYFKTNYWRGRAYDVRVAPLSNANPFVVRHLPLLKASRDTQPSYDVGCVMRVWGGDDELKGIEHNLRLLEAVNTADCRKFLWAYLVAGDIGSMGKRLERQGIPWSTEPLPMDRLWAVSAASRLNVIRLGMHGCVPWRMTDVLAMGGCPVLDQAPHCLWSPALVAGRNFIDLGVNVPAGMALADDDSYAAIPGKLERLLATDEGVAIQRNNAAYFDECLDPTKIGVRICQHVEALGTRRTADVRQADVSRDGNPSEALLQTG